MIASHHGFRGKRREPECRLVGDQDRGWVGERGREAEHLLLAAGQEPGYLLAALGEDGEALVGLAREAPGRAAGRRCSPRR